MKSRPLTRLSDAALLSSAASVIARERGATAEVLAYIAEVDRRKLYVPAGYDSMFAYCVHVWHFSEDAAFMRIRAARAARRFPAILDAVADGRLSLTVVVRLAPYLIEATADEFLAAAATKAEVEQMLAERFPRPDLPTVVQALPPASPARQLVPEPVGTLAEQLVPEPVSMSQDRLVPGAPPSIAGGRPTLCTQPREVMGQGRDGPGRVDQGWRSRSIAGDGIFASRDITTADPRPDSSSAASAVSPPPASPSR